MRKGFFIIILLLGIISAGTLRAGTVVSEEEEYIYRKAPDIRIDTADERNIPLSRAYLEKPVIITLIYTRCTHICYPYVSSLKKRLTEIGGLGTNYRVVILSFDPRDNIEDMKAMEKALGLEKDGNWIFGVSSQKDIGQLMKATGFTVNWDPKTGEYDHPALLIGVEGEGRIVRRLVGFQEVRMLADVVRELKGEFIPFYSMPDKNVLLRCFEYDPESGEWGFSWGFIFIILPAILAFSIVFSIWAYSAHQRFRPNR